MKRKKKSGGKLCLSCYKRIPLLAGRCPYCREEGQDIYGRMIFVIMALAVVWFLATVFTSNDYSEYSNSLLNNEQNVVQVEKKVSKKDLLDSLKGLNVLKQQEEYHGKDN